MTLAQLEGEIRDALLAYGEALLLPEGRPLDLAAPSDPKDNSSRVS